MRWKSGTRISAICFTETGAGLCRKIQRGLEKAGVQCCGYLKCRGARPEDFGLCAVPETLTEWTKKQFEESEGILFIGAVGIAVRAAAPWIADKFRDPAVVAVDESGQFAVPLLSGHVGGANELALLISECTGAVPVITTATDVEQKFAVDVFARERGLWISDREAAKQISADILAGRPVGFFSDFPVKGIVPQGFLEGTVCERNLFVAVRRPEAAKWKAGLQSSGKSKLQDSREEAGRNLWLVPKILTLGIGCRRGIDAGHLQAQVDAWLEKHSIWPQAVKGAATAAQKKEEPALLALCQSRGWEFSWFTAEELRAVEGSFAHSDFVEKTVGVGNVCERAAVLESKGRLFLPKEQLDKMTLAAAQARWQLEF